MLDGVKHFPKMGNMQMLSIQEKQESFGNYVPGVLVCFTENKI